MPTDYLTNASGDPHVQDNISNFIDYLRAKKIVLCEPRVDNHFQTEYVLFEGDIKGLITEFLAGA